MGSDQVLHSLQHYNYAKNEEALYHTTHTLTIDYDRIATSKQLALLPTKTASSQL